VLPELLNLRTTIYYGFTQRCEEIRYPGSDRDLLSFECRPFPTKDSDGCDGANESFCTLWYTAGYVSYLALGFGAVACSAIVFGVSTHSRRKRIWKVVAALIALHGTPESCSVSIRNALHVNVVGCQVSRNLSRFPSSRTFIAWETSPFPRSRTRT
jgi:hypothetical protein